LLLVNGYWNQERCRPRTPIARLVFFSLATGMESPFGAKMWLDMPLRSQWKTRFGSAGKNKRNKKATPSEACQGAFSLPSPRVFELSEFLINQSWSWSLLVYPALLLLSVLYMDSLEEKRFPNPVAKFYAAEVILGHDYSPSKPKTMGLPVYDEARKFDSLFAPRSGPGCLEWSRTNGKGSTKCS